MTKHVIIGSDHRGCDLRQFLGIVLDESQLVGVTTLSSNTDALVNHSTVATEVIDSMKQVGDNTISTPVGVLICGSGIGVSIAANRNPAIRAALCRSVNDAVMARKHNDANVLCIGADITTVTLAVQITKAFINTEYECQL